MDYRKAVRLIPRLRNLYQKTNATGNSLPIIGVMEKDNSQVKENKGNPMELIDQYFFKLNIMNKRTLKKDELHEDVKRLKRKLPKPGADNRKYEADIKRYFEERLEKLKIVKTTETPRGQIIDWIPIESQVSGEEKIASPPDVPYRIILPEGRHRDKLVQFELEDLKLPRGPKGTIPVLRKDLKNIGYDQSLRQLLGKYLINEKHLLMMNGKMQPAPEEGGSHRYASSGQSITNFGGEGVLSAFDPYVENSDDFSLMQIGLSNNDTGKLQTVEAGWQERKDSYGDWVPHLFLFYTTNGYTDDGDNKGGYNQDVDGWIQYDGSVHPGAISSPNSTRGGDQYVMQIKFQLYNNNWWFMCNGRWLGYYPAKLFMGNQSVFSTLGDHADFIGFWGEIYDSNKTPGKTKTDMGSGYWPEYGWTWSAYQRNLKFQSDRNGGLTNYNGVGSAPDPDMYDIEMHMNSGTNWESYFWMGGPGAT